MPKLGPPLPPILNGVPSESETLSCPNRPKGDADGVRASRSMKNVGDIAHGVMGVLGVMQPRSFGEAAARGRNTPGCEAAWPRHRSVRAMALEGGRADAAVRDQPLQSTLT
mmetsp:Transcript_47508/g.133710  ORF Transcript_47508/g.133710 Transcript_47508/m.133710 type:complete len:111 (+) Transcript_47508:184-516(+)